MVRQRTVNPWEQSTTGSSPVLGANTIYAAVAQLAEAADLKSV